MPNLVNDQTYGKNVASAPVRCIIFVPADSGTHSAVPGLLDI